MGHGPKSYRIPAKSIGRAIDGVEDCRARHFGLHLFVHKFPGVRVRMAQLVPICRVGRYTAAPRMRHKPGKDCELRRLLETGNVQF